MDFFYRASGRPSRLAVFPGTFNPMTVAHQAMAHAALAQADEVVLVLPRVLFYSRGIFFFFCSL